MTLAEEDIKNLSLKDKIHFYITITIAAIIMMRQILRQIAWDKKVDSIKIPPKIKPEDRVYKYN